MNCNSVKERLVDFLYEELPAESRTAFEEHLRGCAGCKAEVASYRSALGSARSALSGRLAQEPPARVHDAVMEAAKAAAKTKANARAATRTDTKMGFFAKLWRTPWLMPAFGAASVATVVFLVRVLKNPEVLPGQRPGSIGEQSEPAPAQAVPAPPPEQHAAIANPEQAKAGRAKSESAAVQEPLGPRTRGGKARVARELPRSMEDRKGSAEHLLGGLNFDRDDVPRAADKASMPAATHKKMDRAYDEPSEKGASRGGLEAPSRFAEPPPPRSAEGMIGGAGVERRAHSKDLSAPAGSASILGDSATSNLPKPTPAKRAAAPAPEPASPVGRGPTMAASPLPAAAVPAPMAAPIAPARPTMQKRAEAAKEAEASYAPASVMEEEVTEHKKAKAQPGPSIDESVRRADRLFADRRWNEAAEAYRELLRRYPGHGDAAKWRSRMEHAVIAAGESNEAAKKSAKASSADRDTVQRARP